MKFFKDDFKHFFQFTFEDWNFIKKQYELDIVLEIFGKLDLLN